MAKRYAGNYFLLRGHEMLTNEQRARKAINGLSSVNNDSPVTSEKVSLLWVEGLKEVSNLGYTPYKLKATVNEGVVDKELLQCIFDSLNIYDIA